MIETSALAHSITGSKVFEEIVRRALGWFLGLNTKSIYDYDISSGGCFDGLGEQGSQSTLAFFLASVSVIRNFQSGN